MLWKGADSVVTQWEFAAITEHMFAERADVMWTKKALGAGTSGQDPQAVDTNVEKKRQQLSTACGEALDYSPLAIVSRL